MNTTVAGLLQGAALLVILAVLAAFLGHIQRQIKRKRHTLCDALPFCMKFLRLLLIQLSRLGLLVRRLD